MAANIIVMLLEDTMFIKLYGGKVNYLYVNKKLK